MNARRLFLPSHLSAGNVEPKEKVRDQTEEIEESQDRLAKPEAIYSERFRIR